MRTYDYLKELLHKTIVTVEQYSYEDEKYPITVTYEMVKHLPKPGDVVQVFSNGGKELISSMIEENTFCKERCFTVYTRFENTKGIDPQEEHFMWRLCII